MTHPNVSKTLLEMLRRPRFALLLAIATLVLVLGLYLASRREAPAPETQAYEAIVRSFYSGLASLEIGLITDARDEFTRLTQLAPDEPAAWANLGLAHLRLGEVDEAEGPIGEAATLAPENAAVALLQGRFEATRGRLDQATAHLRRAVELAPSSIRAWFALAQETERAGGDGADLSAQESLETALALAPENLTILLERARLAAKRQDETSLQDAVEALEPQQQRWPPVAAQQYEALRAASDAGDTPGAARATAFLRNVLAPTRAFQESLLAVESAAGLIAEPFGRFLVLPVPGATPAPADRALTFARETLEGAAEPGLAWSSMRAVDVDGGATEVLVAGGSRGGRLQADGFAPVSEQLPGVGGRDGLLALDWNADFQMDLVTVGDAGVRLFVQDENGAFADRTAEADVGGAAMSLSGRGAWAADVEMDGDIDIVIAVVGAAPVVLRNNGDGSWVLLTPFDGVSDLVGFTWGDLDQDGDPDAALLDATATLHVFTNRQAGQFDPLPGPDSLGDVLATSIGDLDADGRFDLVTLHAGGTIRRFSPTGDGTGSAVLWSQQDLVTWSELAATSAGAGTYRLFAADLDNSGALDLVAAGPGGSAIWLADEQLDLSPPAQPDLGDVDVLDVVDLDADGYLDLLGLADGRPLQLLGRGTQPYHWQVVRPRAQLQAGDQRINTFGIGGEIEVRSGLLVQRHPISGPTVHLGLGTREAVDFVRIVWPNGVMQAEFGTGIDQPIVAEQRLKGSCPWVFTYDGTGMQFVTDFLWRSPLGLRINAQDTAGVTQTEDWVRIRGNQLVPRDGAYDVRITAELWETHFFDHVSLWVIDHPVGTEVFVDERFAPQSPSLGLHSMTSPRSIGQAWDETGRDVTDLVAAQDERYLGTFPRGRYQGVATDHWVEIELPHATGGLPRWLVAHGWVYPTDSSINVAMGQGDHTPPKGLSLEMRDASGQWIVAAGDLGFPAGKNKTVLLDLHDLLAGVELEQHAGVRLRLRTNLEVYWDWLAVADAPDGATGEDNVPPLRTTRVQPETADLRFRGYSQTSHDRGGSRETPEVPYYDALANVTQRWRDLIGYYTRFGDVRELLDQTDDRFVIMNAGDEIRFTFPVPPPPTGGDPGSSAEWTRDFVLIGDGWVKDGDFNTRFSQTVHPLPTHARADYDAPSPAPVLEDDPVYRRHRQDWQEYHTRYVTPQRYLRGLLREPVVP